MSHDALRTADARFNSMTRNCNRNSLEIHKSATAMNYRDVSTSYNTFLWLTPQSTTCSSPILPVSQTPGACSSFPASLAMHERAPPTPQVYGR